MPPCLMTNGSHPTWRLKTKVKFKSKEVLKTDCFFYNFVEMISPDSLSESSMWCGFETMF